MKKTLYDKMRLMENYDKELQNLNVALPENHSYCFHLAISSWKSSFSYYRTDDPEYVVREKTLHTIRGINFEIADNAINTEGFMNAVVKLLYKERV